MIELHEQIEVQRALRDVFLYVGDFTTTPQWDATARRAVKVTGGPIGEGSAFDVRVRLPVGRIVIRYRITVYEPDSRVVLVGTCALFSVEDSITFEALDSARTRVDYRARFRFVRGLRGLMRLSRRGMVRMGRTSMAGLVRALADDLPPPRQPRGCTVADRLVLPGVAGFTRQGYRFARRWFRPVSANVEGRHMVLTGASSGLGLAAAQTLAARGARLTLVVRDRDKAEATLRHLRDETGNSALRYELCDLSLMAGVDGLAARLRERGEPVDVLINNAGALFNPRRVTEEGLEASLALLLLAPWRLTLGLMPLLQAAPAARVVNVVSGGMYTQRLDVDRLHNDDGDDYSGSVAYAREKRALMTLTELWADAWSREQRGVAVNAMHPGWADTPGVQAALPGFRRLTRRLLRTPAQGADTMVWLAVATEAAAISGRLYLDRMPRTPYLLERTREPPGERERLLSFLRSYAPA